MKKNHGFTLIDAVICIAIFALLLVVVVPVLHAATIDARKAQDQSQLSTILQGMIKFAKRNSTKNFPPIRTFGPPIQYGGDAAGVFHTLLSVNSSTGKFGGYNPDAVRDNIFISPMARSYMAPYFTWRGTSGGPDYYSCSYGWLNSQTLNHASSLGNKEWKNNGSAQVPLVANRYDPASNNHANWPQSDYAGPPDNPLAWRGNIAWGDGHVNFNVPAPNTSTTYVRTFMSGKVYVKDNIWEYDVAPSATGDAIFGIPVYNLGAQGYAY